MFLLLGELRDVWAPPNLTSTETRASVAASIRYSDVGRCDVVALTWAKSHEISAALWNNGEPGVL